LQLASHSITKIVPTFASGDAGEAVAYIGSGGYLEVAINKGNASKTLGVGRGAPVVLAKE
jgi:S-adenosylmethionine hydrolase